MGDCALALLLTDDAEPDGERASRPARHLVPATLSPNVYQLVRKLALAAHRALGCRGVSRADFSWDGNAEDVGGRVCLAIDTQPGMTETSLAPEIAAHAGISFGELVRWMVEDGSFCR
jgi:D-alanine-D-alanine ligase